MIRRRLWAVLVAVGLIAGFVPAGAHAALGDGAGFGVQASHEDVSVVLDGGIEEVPLDVNVPSNPVSENQSATVSFEATDQGVKVLVALEGVVDERVEESVTLSDVEDLPENAVETVVSLHDAAIAVCNSVVQNLGTFECAALI